MRRVVTLVSSTILWFYPHEKLNHILLKLSYYTLLLFSGGSWMSTRNINYTKSKTKETWIYQHKTQKKKKKNKKTKKQKQKPKHMKFYNCFLWGLLFWNHCLISSLSILRVTSLSMYIVKQPFTRWSSTGWFISNLLWSK